MAATRVSHVGICVSDLERSVRFYCEALGFEPAGSHQVGAEFGRLMELPDVTLRSRFVRRDGLSLELLGFEHPASRGDGARRPMNALGFTHLSLRVDDVDAVASAVEAHGGRCWAETRTTMDLDGVLLDFVYCTDPDGVRVELMRLPD